MLPASTPLGENAEGKWVQRYVAVFVIRKSVLFNIPVIISKVCRRALLDFAAIFCYTAKQADSNIYFVLLSFLDSTFFQIRGLHMKRAYFKYLLALFLFGSNGIFAMQISLNSYEIVLLRTLIGSLLLIAIFLLSKGRLTSWQQHKRQYAFLGMSGIAMGTSWMFLYEAYQQIGVSVSSLMYYCGPLIVMVLSPLLFREKLTWLKGIGFIAVLYGIFLVNGQALQMGKTGWGLFFGGMSAVMYAVMVICNKQSGDITGLENSMLQLCISFLTVAVFVGIKQGFAIHVESSNWLPVLILGLLNTGTGCYFYFSSIGKLSVQTVAVCGYLEPLSAVLFSVLLLHEPMRPIQIIGAALIIGGAIFGELIKPQKLAKE